MNNKLIYTILALFFVFISCSDDREYEQEGKEYVSIRANVNNIKPANRSGSTPLDGSYYLYYAPADPSDANYEGMSTHEYQCEGGTFTSSTRLYWDDINATRNTFYLTNMDAMEFPEEGVSDTDILFGAATGWKTTPGLDFELEHLLSKLSVVLVDETLKGDIIFNNAKVVFKRGLIRKMTGIDHAAGKATFNEEDRETRTTTTDKTIGDKQVVLPVGYFAPQTFAETDSMEITAGDYIYRIPVPEKDNQALAMAAGEHLTITIRLTEHFMKASAELIDWNAVPGNDIEVSRVFNIGNWNELKDLMQAINSGYTFKGMVVRLTKNIAIQGQISLGNAENPFEGIFDGGGNTISKLGSSETGEGLLENSGGLFAYTRGATLQNVVIEAPHVTSAGGAVGALVDRAENTTIFNCRAQSKDGDGTVKGKSDYTGGLVGIAIGESSLTNCYTSIVVKGGTDYTGGLVGYSEGSITHCYAIGDVECKSGSYVGGLAGYMNAAMQYCYAWGDVEGHSQIGGLIGYLDGQATSCYADGDVLMYGSERGGLVGNLGFDGVAKNCYWKSSTYGGSGSADLGSSCEAYTSPADLFGKLNNDDGVWKQRDTNSLPIFND